jgi:hypothetical protein
VRQPSTYNPKAIAALITNNKKTDITRLFEDQTSRFFQYLDSTQQIASTYCDTVLNHITRAGAINDKAMQTLNLFFTLVQRSDQPYSTRQHDEAGAADDCITITSKKSSHSSPVKKQRKIASIADIYDIDGIAYSINENNTYSIIQLFSHKSEHRTEFIAHLTEQKEKFEDYIQSIKETFAASFPNNSAAQHFLHYSDDSEPPCIYTPIYEAMALDISCDTLKKQIESDLEEKELLTTQACEALKKFVSKSLDLTSRYGKMLDKKYGIALAASAQRMSKLAASTPKKSTQSPDSKPPASAQTTSSSKKKAAPKKTSPIKQPAQSKTSEKGKFKKPSRAVVISPIQQINEDEPKESHILTIAKDHIQAATLLLDRTEPTMSIEHPRLSFDDYCKTLENIIAAQQGLSYFFRDTRLKYQKALKQKSAAAELLKQTETILTRWFRLATPDDIASIETIKLEQLLCGGQNGAQMDFINIRLALTQHKDYKLPDDILSGDSNAYYHILQEYIQRQQSDITKLLHPAPADPALPPLPPSHTEQRAALALLNQTLFNLLALPLPTAILIHPIINQVEEYLDNFETYAYELSIEKDQELYQDLGHLYWILAEHSSPRCRKEIPLLLSKIEAQKQLLKYVIFQPATSAFINYRDARNAYLLQQANVATELLFPPAPADHLPPLPTPLENQIKALDLIKKNIEGIILLRATTTQHLIHRVMQPLDQFLDHLSCFCLTEHDIEQKRHLNESICAIMTLLTKNPSHFTDYRIETLLFKLSYALIYIAGVEADFSQFMKITTHFSDTNVATQTIETRSKHQYLLKALGNAITIKMQKLKGTQSSTQTIQDAINQMFKRRNNPEDNDTPHAAEVRKKERTSDTKTGKKPGLFLQQPLSKDSGGPAISSTPHDLKIDSFATIGSPNDSGISCTSSNGTGRAGFFIADKSTPSASHGTMSDFDKKTSGKRKCRLKDRTSILHDAGSTNTTSPKKARFSGSESTLAALLNVAATEITREQGNTTPARENPSPN